MKDYALLNDVNRLIPLGVLTTDAIRLPGPEPEAPDGWNWLPPGFAETCKWLDYLASVDAVRLTYAIREVVIIRVYAVPGAILRGVDGLLNALDGSESSWNGVIQYKPVWQRRTMTLAQMYNNIESPTGDITVPGMISTLYPYQARSVSTMLQHEIEPKPFVDPRLIRIDGPVTSYLDGNKFFRFPAMVTAPRGGILGEEMGSGKTCEVLALILASLGQTPVIPEFTEVIMSDIPAHTLAEHAAKAAQTVPWQWQYLSDTCVRLLKKYRQSYVIPPPPPRTRRPVIQLGRRVDLSHATLIVVPDTLVDQWQHEIRKHVQQGALRVLVVTRGPLKNLLEYDIVLISHSRFSREEEQIGAVSRCLCAYAGNTRIIDCTCPPPQNYVSPLTSIHWLRLIVDEGHTMSSHNKAVRFAASLFVERRWVVSGTPSRGLVGASAEGYEMQNEKFDLEKLGLTMEFLKVPLKQSWRNLSKRFHKRDPGDAVVDLFNAVFVRNRQADISKDVVLPPLTRKTVLLDCTPSNMQAQNIFNALIAVNAVTSQRVDQDYFFHKSQNTALQAIVRNILQSTFYWTGTSLKMISDACDIATRCLEKYEGADHDLLQQAISVFQTAMNDPIWLDCSISHEMSYYLDSFPEDAKRYYCRHNSYTGGSLNRAQNAVLEAASIAMDTDTDLDEHYTHWLTVAGVRHLKNTKRTVMHPPPPWKTNLTHTSSAKLNYLLSEIVKHDEKILIFSDFVDHSFHLAEALDIIGVEYLLYASTLTAERKSQYIMTFNTSEKFRVMIMDLQLAAHGLNLSTASRVYFIRQVWSGAVESQAIKRAHRIGQTRPVHVETLVLKGTIEEMIYRRRLSLSASEVGDTKNITDDYILRSAIRNPTFITNSSVSTAEYGIFHLHQKKESDIKRRKP